MCRAMVPSLVAPVLTVRVWLIVLVHVGVQQLPLFNVVVVVLLPKKSSCSSYDPTCTSRTPSLVKFLYEVIQICVENFGRVSFVFMQTKQKYDTNICIPYTHIHLNP
jgi:hypothetical protein